MNRYIFLLLIITSLNATGQDLTVDGNMKVQSEGIISANRGRIGFSHVWTDWNHTIYNNYNNIDGEGVWDGMKFNVYRGADFRVGSSKTSALFIDEGGGIGLGTTNPSGLLSMGRSTTNSGNKEWNLG